MTNPKLTSEEAENADPSEDTVVQRKEGESYLIQISVVSRNAVEETKASTYKRRNGHYFVPKEECPDATRKIDQLLTEIAADKNIITGLKRSIEEGYELHVLIDDDFDKNTTFSNSNSAQLNLTEEDKCEKFDEILEHIEDSL